MRPGKPAKDRVDLEAIRRIIETTARYYGINPVDITAPHRQAWVVEPRQVAMYLARTNTTASYPDLAYNFRRRDHTTIIHGVRIIKRFGPFNAVRAIEKLLEA